MDIVNLLKSMPNFIGGKGISLKRILYCEKELNLKFSSEYKSYLLNIGIANFKDHEITGIWNEKRQNVVYDTLKYREILPELSKKLYLIENLGIDGILIWQDEDGFIYQTIGTNKEEKIFSSLYNYIKSLQDNPNEDSNIAFTNKEYI